MPVLGATELTVFKAFFDRTKDWADIEAMIDAGTVDIHAALGWLVDLLGGDDHRVDRLRKLLDRKPPAAEPRFMPRLTRGAPHGGDDGAVAGERELLAWLEAQPAVTREVLRVARLEIRGHVLGVDCGEVLRQEPLAETLPTGRASA